MRHRLPTGVWILYSLFVIVILTRPPGLVDYAKTYFDGVDIAGHVGVFALWGFVFGIVLRAAGSRSRWWIFGFVLAGSAVFGLLTEILQNAVAGRSAGFVDLVGDVVGAGLGGSLCAILPDGALRALLDSQTRREKKDPRGSHGEP